MLVGYLVGSLCTLATYYFVYGLSLGEEKRDTREVRELEVSFVCSHSFSFR